MVIVIKELIQANFQSFGKIIEFPEKKISDGNKNLFHVVCREKESLGWRIAYLIVREKTISRMEHHPLSLETFEPVKGKTLIYLSKTKKIEDINCFLLDKPVILNKGIWHGVVTLNEQSEIKITENLKVKCVYWKLNHQLGLEKQMSIMV